MSGPAIVRKTKQYKQGRTQSVDRTRSARRRAGGKRNKKLNNVIQEWSNDRRAS